MLPPAPSIGGLQLSSPLLLAPLSGYTNVAFRLGVRRLGGLGGLGLAFTDLANPIGVMRRNLKTKQILATCEEDRPLAVQLYGADAGNMAEAARALAGGGTEIIDINMGCPVHKVVRKGGGSALLADPERAARLAARVVAAVDVPVTVKLRLGTDAANITAPRLAGLLAEVGVAALTVHGRTADQRYSGRVDLEGIARTVEAAGKVPVFANGDVNSPESARRMLEATGAAGLAIGRAAMRNPWIFSQLCAISNGQSPPAPTRAERIEFMRGHFRRMIELLGPQQACIRFRKWGKHYGVGMGLSRPERTRILRLAEPRELELLAAELTASS